MRIVYLVPGPAGPFFEKNSLREQALVAELRWCGHDVMLIPLLFPITPGRDNAAAMADTPPVFGGAVRVYARHALPFLTRHAPEWLWRRLDAPWLRRLIARRVLASPRRFSEFMRDALDGRNGPLVAEMRHLCAWLGQQPPPDIILLSTPFLLGTAGLLKRSIRVPVCCAMDTEIEDMAHLRGPEGILLLTKIRGIIGEADGFLPVSHFHAARIQNRFGIPESSIRTVHPGVDYAAFETASAPPVASVAVVVRGGAGPDVPNLVTVITRLQAAHATVRVLHSTGPQPPEALAGTGVKADVLPHSRIKFQASIRSFTAFVFLHGNPPPAFDTLALEVLASGIPIVMPRQGANAEIAAFSPAVFLYDDADTLIRLTAHLLALGDTDAAALRAKARRSVELHFSLPRMAQETADALKAAVKRCSHRPDTWDLRPGSAAPPSDSPPPSTP